MVQIKLERIGDDERWLCSKKSKEDCIELYLKKRIRDERNIFLNGNSRAWCAKLVGVKQNGTTIIKKEFLKPSISYLESNGTGSRGVYAFYNLENGNFYEVNSPVSWKDDEHYFCKIENNKVIEITLKEIVQCQNNLLE
jgi:hypothetical protein